MHLYELADEFHMTSGEALDVCDHVGINAASGGDEVAPADVERFRQAVARTTAPPPAQVMAPAAPPPPPAFPTAPAPAAAWAAPDAPDMAAGWGAPFSPPPNGVSTGAAPGIPPAPAAFPQAAAAYPHPAPAPYPQADAAAYAPPAPMGVTPVDLARLADARKRANSVLMSGFGVLALAVLITGGTLILAPGGFFIVSIGAFVVGVRRIVAGRQALSRVSQAERQLGIRPGGR
jgi:hypothetical protein